MGKVNWDALAKQVAKELGPGATVVRGPTERPASYLKPSRRRTRRPSAPPTERRLPVRKTPTAPAKRRPKTQSRPKLRPDAVPNLSQPAPPTTARHAQQVERTFAPAIPAEVPKIPVGLSPTPRPTPAAEVVRAAKPASVSITLPPPIVTARARIEGDPSATYAFSSKDPDRAYLMRHRIVPLSDVIPSQLDSLQPNPDYPSELQPRDRTRQAS